MWKQIALGRLSTALSVHEDCEQPQCDVSRIDFFALRCNELELLASDQYVTSYAPQLLDERNLARPLGVNWRWRNSAMNFSSL